MLQYKKTEEEYKVNMKMVQKTIDVNAHIENLQYEINVDNGSAMAEISFNNLGYGDIIAIKFNAHGYNSFGDIILINGKNVFSLIIQDIKIMRNEFSNGLKVKLPDPSIRKLDLTECQICYADGTIVSYEGKKDFTVELIEIDDYEQITALHELYDQRAKYKPQDFEEGWICSCGRFNKSDKSVCSLCRKNKNDTMKICSDDNLKGLVTEYKEKEKQKKQIEEATRKKVNKEKKIKGILTGIVIACIISIFPICYAVRIGQRTIYSSESEMKEALNGTWTCYENGYDPKYRIKVEDNVLTKRWVDLGSGYDINIPIKKWCPKKGTFETSSGTYTVLKNGKIKDRDGNEYEHVGYLITDDDNSSDVLNKTYIQENGYSVLKISDISWDNNSSYNVCAYSARTAHPFQRNGAPFRFKLSKAQQVD